jgi:hypothetical protein
MAKIKNPATLSGKPERLHKMKLDNDLSPALKTELIELIDDFAEFSEISAFLCHAYATSLSDPKWLNQEITSGARICSIWLQSRTCKLKDDIQHIREAFSNSKS